MKTEKSLIRTHIYTPYTRRTCTLHFHRPSPYPESLLPDVLPGLDVRMIRRLPCHRHVMPGRALPRDDPSRSALRTSPAAFGSQSVFHAESIRPRPAFQSAGRYRCARSLNANRETIAYPRVVRRTQRGVTRSEKNNVTNKWRGTGNRADGSRIGRRRSRYGPFRLNAIRRAVSLHMKHAVHVYPRPGPAIEIFDGNSCFTVSLRAPPLKLLPLSRIVRRDRNPRRTSSAAHYFNDQTCRGVTLTEIIAFADATPYPPP